MAISQLEARVVWLASQCCGEDLAAALQFKEAKARGLETSPLLREDAEDGQGPLDAPNQLLLSPTSAVGGPLVSHPANSQGPPQQVLVMRHAHRADEDDDNWTRTAARPWDPPLSKLGREQAREAAHQLRLSHQPQLQAAYVISSPFLRCLQTSAEVVVALGLPEGRWLVDWSMGEIAEPRLLLGGRPDVEDKVQGRPIESWMWGGSSATEALRKWAQVESSISGVAYGPVLLPRPPPPYPESREAALGRYTDELGWLASGGRGLLKGNCVVVTHGEAVRSAVNLLEPQATVYEVRHCGHVLLTRPRGSAGVNGDQQLGGDDPGKGAQAGLPDGGTSYTRLRDLGWSLGFKSGETGVSWFA